MRKLLRYAAFITAFAVTALTACSSVNTPVEDAAASVDTSVTTTAQTSEKTTPITTEPITTSEEPEPVINDKLVSAEFAISYDTKAQRVIYEKNADEITYPASTTKLMTALTAIKSVDDDFIFTVGSEITLIDPASSVAQLAQGQKLSLTAMLTAMLIPSGNDAAYCVAANVAREVSGEQLSDTEAISYFAELMNNYAAELGCTNTHFTVPDGIHDPDHYTTVRDMLKIAVAAADSEIIRGITKQTDVQVIYETGEIATWPVGNPLMYDEDFNFEGLKSGLTDEAGYCFVGICTDKENDRDIITVVFNADSVDKRNKDTLTLVDMAINGYIPNSVAAYTEIE